MISLLKGSGYFISMISVFLLAIVSASAARKSPLLLACLAAGVTTSIIGMLLRWHAHRVEQQGKNATGHHAAGV